MNLYYTCNFGGAASFYRIQMRPCCVLVQFQIASLFNLDPRYETFLLLIQYLWWLLLWGISTNLTYWFQGLMNWISSRNSKQSNYGKKKNQTVTSFAHKSFENSPSELKFLLKLVFSIIKHHQKNQWPTLISLGIIDF